VHNLNSLGMLVEALGRLERRPGSTR